MVPQQDLQNGDHNPPQQQIGNFEAPADDFLDQMLSSLPCWNEFATQNGHSKSAWDLKQDDESPVVHLEDSAMQHQMNGMSKSAERMMLQQQQQWLMPPRRQNGVGDSSCLFDSPNSEGLESSIQGLYNGFAELLQSQQFLQSQRVPDQGIGIGSGGSAPPRQRVRARRGQATDPHSIAERLRRERIAERMKGLQELVPNANKTDKASMLDEIIDYVKFLQLQVKVLSMSRLGGAAAVVTEGGDAIAQTTDDTAMTVTEHQVAKLMEEDMGSAMQYLQGKGLCLMPISLATAISTATCHSLPDNNANGMFLANGAGPTSPSASVLTVQSSAFVNDLTSGLG